MPRHLPVGEDYPADPIDAYGRSKQLATRSGLAERPPLEVTVGPDLQPDRARDSRRLRRSARFAARLAEPGPDPLDLPVGDLDARRDFVDVRDVARAMIALALHGQAGTGLSRRDGLSPARSARGSTILIDSSGRSVRTRVDPADAAVPAPRLPRRDRPDRRRDRLGAADLVRARASTISGDEVRGSTGGSTRWRGAVAPGPDRVALAIDRLSGLSYNLASKTVVPDSGPMIMEDRDGRPPESARDRPARGEPARHRDRADPAAGPGWPQVHPVRAAIPDAIRGPTSSEAPMSIRSTRP